MTRPNEPAEPEVVDGSSVSDAGCGCGVSVVVAWTETPCQVAVIVTGVSVATRLVGMLKEVDSMPAGTVTVAGGRAARRELVRLTTAPPGGACPCSITMPPLVTPPFSRSGTPSRPSSEAGLTVKVCVVASEPIVAVTVTVTGAVTCPVLKLNRRNDVAPCTATDAGSGAACGFELDSVTVAPAAGTARFSWRSTSVSWPLARLPVRSVMVLTRSGPLAIVNVPVGDQAVAAAVPAVLITPWKDRTRQNFGPAVGRVRTS